MMRGEAVFGTSLSPERTVFGASRRIHGEPHGVHALTALLASLADFIACGLRPRTPLARAIVLVLAVKLVAIIAIKVLLFPDAAQPLVDAGAIAHLIGPTAPLR